MISASYFKEQVQHLLNDGATLIRKEFELATAELMEKVVMLRSGIVSLLAGLLVGLVGLIFLGHTAVSWLSLSFSPQASMLIVALFFLVVSFFMLLNARTKLSADELEPHRTVHAAKTIAAEVTGGKRG